MKNKLFFNEVLYYGFQEISYADYEILTQLSEHTPGLVNITFALGWAFLKISISQEVIQAKRIPPKAWRHLYIVKSSVMPIGRPQITWGVTLIGVCRISELSHMPPGGVAVYIRHCNSPVYPQVMQDLVEYCGPYSSSVYKGQGHRVKV